MTMYNELLNNLQIQKLNSSGHFVAYARKPTNMLNIAFQTHDSRVGTLRSDVCKLLRVICFDQLHWTIRAMETDSNDNVCFQELNRLPKEV